MTSLESRKPLASTGIKLIIALLLNLGDKAAMLHGYKRLRDVWADKSLSKLVVREVFPGSAVTSDEDLWRAIQNSATTFHHPVSELGRI